MKEERAGLTEDKLIELFDNATWNCFNHVELMSLALQDENKLDDMYSIGFLIYKARAAFIHYDMHDVFNITKVKSDGKNLKGGSKDLFTEYSESLFFGQNLKLTQEFMADHTTERLWEKCLGTYEGYPTEEQVGWLIFIIMIKLLDIDTESAVTFLQRTIEKIKISDH